jgi:hypothetical protein
MCHIRSFRSASVVCITFIREITYLNHNTICSRPAIASTLGMGMARYELMLDVWRMEGNYLSPDN